LAGIVFSNNVYVYDDSEGNLDDLPEDKFFMDLASNLESGGKRSSAELRTNTAEVKYYKCLFVKILMLSLYVIIVDGVVIEIFERKK
jgi:hypothetical protein